MSNGQRINRRSKPRQLKRTKSNVKSPKARGSKRLKQIRRRKSVRQFGEYGTSDYNVADYFGELVYIPKPPEWYHTNI